MSANLPCERIHTYSILYIWNTTNTNRNEKQKDQCGGRMVHYNEWATRKDTFPTTGSSSSWRPKPGQNSPAGRQRFIKCWDVITFLHIWDWPQWWQHFCKWDFHPGDEKMEIISATQATSMLVKSCWNQSTPDHIHASLTDTQIETSLYICLQPLVLQ